MTTSAELLLFVATEHPHVATKIEATWETPEFFDVMHELVISNRTWPNHRNGFSQPVFEAIIKLWEIHEQQYPHIRNKRDFTPVVW